MHAVDALRQVVQPHAEVAVAVRRARAARRHLDPLELQQGVHDVSNRWFRLACRLLHQLSQSFDRAIVRVQMRYSSIGLE